MVSPDVLVDLAASPLIPELYKTTEGLLGRRTLGRQIDDLLTDTTKIRAQWAFDWNVVFKKNSLDTVFPGRNLPSKARNGQSSNR
jgi:hypothetical protein